LVSPSHTDSQLPGVTIVILNYNGKHWLEQFLPSVLATDYPTFDVLVADNASTDDSLAFLAAHYPSVRTLALPENYGFAEGNNRAMAAVHTPYLVLLNSDVAVTPGWLGPLVARAEAQPRLAGLQPKILAYTQPTHFEYAGAAGGYLDLLAIPLCRGRVLHILEPDEGQYDTYQSCFWATGACLFLRTSVVQEVGLFEPAYFAHMEEIDFCWRAQRAGWQFACEPASVVYHVGGGTLAQENPRKTYLNVRNSLFTIVRNLPATQALMLVFLRLLIDGLAGLHFLLKGEPAFTRAIIRAHWHFFPVWRTQRKRAAGWPRPPLAQLAGVVPCWILVDYYLRGKKKFAQLEN
jgi:GT2 family glycosyltransferase